MSKESAWKKRKKKKEGVWVSPHYAGVARAVTRCSVFVACASSRLVSNLMVVGSGWVFSGVVRVCCGLRWCSGFSQCAQWFRFSRLGLANFAVVGGWFECGFRRARWTNPPPSPNGEVEPLSQGQSLRRGGINIVLLGKRGKTRIN
jgi:hypothetical protein